jgi:uncharacterized membrane protein (DUF4010 family)
MNKNRFIVLTGMILTATAARLVPHLPDFSPIAALALFGGASFASKRTALLVPLLGLFLSDLVIGFYSVTPVVYASFALITCLGFWVRKRQSPKRLATAAVASAVLFFVVTNFGVWALETFYPKNLTGLIDCYVAAIPFFRNTLASDLLFSAMLFGGLSFAEKRWPALGESAPAAAGA